MKRFLYALTAVAVMMGAVACEDPKGTEENPKGGDDPVPDPVKTVVVGAQVGTLTAGEAGSVTFAVTTENIAAGEYTAVVANLPAGVTAGKVTIAANKGTLTLSGTAASATVVNNLKLTIDGTQSNSFTLTVNGAPVDPDPEKTLTVGAIKEVPTVSGKFVAGNVTSRADYDVTATGFKDGAILELVANNLPAGVSLRLSSIQVYGGKCTFSFIGSANTVAGVTNNVTVTANGITSNEFTITVEEAPTSGTITVSPDTYTIAQGGNNEMPFTVSSSDNFVASLSSDQIEGYSEAQAAGVSFNFAMFAFSKKIAVSATVSATPGDYPMTIVVNGVRSNTFTLTVAAPTGR